jgi:phosphocarrier protein
MTCGVQRNSRPETHQIRSALAITANESQVRFPSNSGLPSEQIPRIVTRMSVQGKAVIQNEAGIHCRPSAHIVKSVQGYSGDMRVWNEDGESDLRSMLSLMMMALTCGTEINVAVCGPNEAAQLEAVIGLLEKVYDFPPQP